MPHAIIRGANGRRHEVDFGDAPVHVEIHASEETVEIFVEANFETLPEERRRFALVNVPRHLFSEATATVARRAPSPVLRVPEPIFVAALIGTDRLRHPYPTRRGRPLPM